MNRIKTSRGPHSNTVIAHLALGSNLGDRPHTIAEAIRLIGELGGTEVTATSSLYSTPPAYVLDQPEFLNAAVTVKTSLEPAEFLRELLAIEQALGRVRVVQNGPRSIDLDILLWGDAVIDTPELSIPHPSMHERDFVLVPLAEIAPGALHPVLKSSVDELLGSIDVDGIVKFEAPARTGAAD